MHWVLQMALDPHPGADNPCAGLRPFLELDDAAMAELAGLLVDEYAKRYLPEDTARFAYLLSRLKKAWQAFLCYLRDEQRQSCFKPVACELKIGSGEDAVPPKYTTCRTGAPSSWSVPWTVPTSGSRTTAPAGCGWWTIRPAAKSWT